MTRLRSRRPQTVTTGLLCAIALAAAGGSATGATTGSSPTGGGTTVPGTSIGPATTVGGTAPQPKPSPNEAVSAAVRPRAGGTRTPFMVALTPRHRLGAQGLRNSFYRLTVTAGTQQGSGSCLSTETAIASHGEAGRRTSVVLRARKHAWCRALYRGVIRYQSGPKCTGGNARAICPEFASQDILAGRFSFRVS